MIKLDASSYSIRKPMMEDLVYCKDLYDNIELKGKKPERIGLTREKIKWEFYSYS